MKKVFAVLLCVIILASFPLRSAPAYAIGPGLMIAGSTVINGSIAALIASIVAQPMGLVDQINAAAEAAGVRAVDHLETLIRNYATSAQVPITSIYTLLNAGVMYAANGAITLSENASEFFGDFFDWAHSEEGGNLQQYDTAGSVSDGNNELNTSNIENSPYDLSSLSYPIYISNQVYFKSVRGDSVWGSNSSVRVITDSNYVWMVSLSPFDAYSYGPDGITDAYLMGSAGQRTFSDGKTYYLWYGIYGNNGYLTVYYPQTYNGFAGTPEVFYAVLFGSAGSSSVNTDVYDFESGSGYDTNIVYAGDVVAIPDFGDPNKQGTADIAGWLGGVSDVIYTGGGTISVTDDQGVTADYGMTKSQVDDMQIVKSSAATVDQVVGGTVSGVGSGTVQGELADYTLDLRDFFPFCIPFDIYRMLSLFAASREAPHVEWRFLVPGIVDETIEIDLGVFDTVAAALRSVELIAAAIGLALMTKRLIQGGD